MGRRNADDPEQSEVQGGHMISRAATRSRTNPTALVPALVIVAGLVLIASFATMAGADVAHTGCNSVAAGGSSGWCGLYPGNATDNVRELGQVSINASGTTLTVQTADASTGVLPATSFACLLFTPPSEIVHRLQDQQCASAGGVWFPIAGSSQTIDLTAYPQFLNAQFTVQVAANQDAKNSNGDAFYNNIAVDTRSGISPG
jgi:hypothetical protein